VVKCMPATTELMWLANALVFIGFMGIGWTLVGWLQQTRWAEARTKKTKW
jgi:hypothetical protein